MPTKTEKDALTGTEIRGHDWDGITELATPLPKWWVYTFYACIAFAAVYVILFPSLPGLDGVLGWSQRVEIEEQLAAAAERQAPFTDQISEMTRDDIRADSQLFGFALAGGRAAFGINCAPCHGAGGGGAKGFPNLADDDWLWGGDLASIHLTVQYGVRSEHDETRISDMPPFGTDELLTPEQISDVAEFVLSLGGGGEDAAAGERGAATFAEECAVCHGDNGEGNLELGAPRLDDPIWLYGGDKASVIQSITSARGGVMPAWTERLDAATVKMLAVYVHSIGGGQ